MKKQSVLVKTLILHTGYVEDQSNSGMFLSNTSGFADGVNVSAINLALLDLALIFKNHFAPAPNKGNQVCGCSPRKYDVSAKFCLYCGIKLQRKLDIKPIIVEGILEMLNGTVNDLSNDLHEDLIVSGWSFQYTDVDMKKAYVVSRADEILADIACDNLQNEQFNSAMVHKVRT